MSNEEKKQSTFVFEEPDKRKKCDSALVVALRIAFDKLSSDIEKVRPSVRADLREDLLADIQSIKKTANCAIDLALANEQAIKSIKEDVTQLQITCSGLEVENKRLKIQNEQHENYSRKDNLIFRGIQEENSETEEKCSEKVRKLFVEKLMLDEALVNSMMFVRCHRLGGKQSRDTRPRPIILRFEHFSDRKTIWGRRFKLAGTSFSMSEHFARSVEYKRNKLYPILSKAKKSGNYNRKAYLNGDTLRINDQDYTVDDLEKLPADIHPRTLSNRTNQEYIVFGGIHSEYNFLSNYCKLKEPLVVKNNCYKTVEHGFHHIKATRYKDQESALKILSAGDPAEAKYFGQSIKNFDSKDWNEVKGSVMTELLRVKFAPDSDLAAQLVMTNGKKLAEAGISKSFAIGLPLSHPQIFNRNAWTGENILGENLMKVRAELM